jgi:hypothetical protein
MINRNTDTIKEVKEAFKAQQLTDSLDNPIAVVNVNPKSFRNINIVKTRASNGAIYTTPNNQDFYLIGLSIVAHGTTTANNTITTTSELGESITLVNIDTRVSVVVDVDSQNLNIMFPIPIKIPRNTAITLTVGSTSCKAVIYGYNVENVGA